MCSENINETDWGSPKETQIIRRSADILASIFSVAKDAARDLDLGQCELHVKHCSVHNQACVLSEPGTLCCTSREPLKTMPSYSERMGRHCRTGLQNAKITRVSPANTRWVQNSYTGHFNWLDLRCHKGREGRDTQFSRFTSEPVRHGPLPLHWRTAQKPLMLPLPSVLLSTNVISQVNKSVHPMVFKFEISGSWDLLSRAKQPDGSMSIG